MTITEVEQWFGNLRKVCLAINIAAQNSTQWKLQGYIPWKQQFKIGMITEGALMPDEEDPYIDFRKKLKSNERSQDAKDVEVNDGGSMCT